MSIMVGITVRGRGEEWKIERRIASGGFGEVFHAVRVKPSPGEGAVKVPAKHIQADPIWAKKFEREARILGNLSHPNVVKILNFWRFADGEMALLQEYVPKAKTISNYFADPGIDRVGIMLQALYGLRGIHGTEDSGVIHRDIAPQNVLIDPAIGTVNIIDFGLACENPRVTKLLTGPGAWFGTRGCCSPEQIKDAANVDKRCDLFGMGRTFAAALQHRSPEFVEMDKLPRPWGDICRALAEYDRDDRPPDVDAAISLVVQAATAAGIAVHDLGPHVREVTSTGIEPEGWPAFCGVYFRRAIRQTLELKDVGLASRISSTVFADPAFDADGLFEHINAGAITEHFAARESTFEGVDPFGQYLQRTYGALTATNKVLCFRRLVRTAVDYHRYELMAHVRTIYGHEADRAIARDLLRALAEEDTEGVIEGRGVIPIERQAAA